MRNPRLTRVRKIAMPETIEIDVPRRGIGSDLTEVLATYGLRAEIVDSEDRCRLQVTWAEDERERLLVGAIHAIESYLSDRMLPLVVQRANGGAGVRPPGAQPPGRSGGAGGAPLRHDAPPLVRSYWLTQRAAMSTV